MHRHRTLVSAMYSILVGLLVVPLAGSAWADAPSPGSPSAPAAGAPQTVTLVTGDQVVVTNSGSTVLAVSPGKGRERVSYVTQRIAEHLYVLPTDTLALVSAGRLDRRLFDVTALVGQRYQDGARADVPLVVQYAQPTARTEARATLSFAGATVASDLPAARGLAVRVQKRDATAFWTNLTAKASSGNVLGAGLDRIWLDGRRRVQLDQSVPKVGAPTVWQAGYTGAGVTVAVIDTGFDTTHPDLAGKVVAERNFTTAPTAEDLVGHGTHVASTIAGSGAASDGMYKGMAPDAKLASGKVCEDIFCDESAMLAAMQWAAADVRAKVVNMSIGGWDSPEIDPVEEAVNSLTAQYGTLFVISAGNAGPNGETVSSPGSADAALTVAATTKLDEVAEFSSRGPRVGDGAIKPDIAAPGVEIVAAKARNNWIGEPVGDTYLKLSGTSMAAPHVAGAAALLASQHPDWAPGQLKAALTSSAVPISAADLFAVGSGRLDVARAFQTQLFAEPSSLSLGIQLWPHGDDEPLVRTLTYRNYGSAAVNLTIAVDATAPYGEPVPAGMFAFSPAEVTVPAGGKADVTVTTDTRDLQLTGRYLGRVTAKSGSDLVAVTPLAVEVESERYAVTLRHTDASGNPSTEYYTSLFRTDMYDERYIWQQPGAVTLRLPKATYAMMSVIRTASETPDQVESLVAYPVLKVDRDMSIDIDARQAKPVHFTTPQPADPIALNVGIDGNLGWTKYSWQLLDPAGARITSLHMGPAAPKDRVIGRVEARLAPSQTVGGNATGDYRYNLAKYLPGVAPTGLNLTVRKSDLAAVDETFLASRPGLVGDKGVTPSPTIADWVSPAWMYTTEQFALPSRRIEYYTGRDVQWSLSTNQSSPDQWQLYYQGTGEPLILRAGRRYEIRWNSAVFGPSTLSQSLTRNGSQLMGSIPMFSDGVLGHVGYGPWDTARTVLYRDGLKIVEVNECGSIWAEVPMQAAQYRLTVDVTRGSYADVSTRMSATWTFESGFTGERPVRIPMMSVRFMPVLDDYNTAPAGGRFTVPVAVEGSVDGVRSLTVDVSYDEGGTWQPATLKQTRDGWTAEVVHPAGSGHVSLRAEAVDGGGFTVREVIYRAYLIK